ncbi:hypothetical protein CYMTET_39077 [Cymbomonas tetramitiformis]|uniref:Uncharacterized protein n=1 Tax=Cymbomonas tetramitiformis TaxID=36881 RepID=A0AAE0CC89_9CHLO|nr:hypothetical protein CYMTET_39077 [Cymbomonas tetramitiformis]
MHDVWRTQCWEHRDFGELLMMIIINAFNWWSFSDAVGKLMQAQFASGQNVNPQEHFFAHLCHELFSNPFLTPADKDSGVADEEAAGNQPAAAATPGFGSRRGSTQGTTSPRSPPTGDRVPVTTVGQSEISGASVAETMQHKCLPQPLSKGVQAKCGVPGCSSETVCKGKTIHDPFKTSVKCGRCHLKFNGKE